MEKLANQIYLFMFKRDKPVSKMTMENLITEVDDYNSYHKVDEAIRELSRLGLINGNEDKYTLTQEAKKAILNLPVEFTEKPYDWFKFREELIEQEEQTKKWYDTENARIMYENYPELQKRAKRAEIIAASAAMLSILELVIIVISSIHD